MIPIIYTIIVIHGCVGFPFAGDGYRQSPIDISRMAITYESELKETPLTIRYIPEQSITLINDGYTLAVSMNKNSTVAGGPLADAYRLNQFHLHWGCFNDRGSEHTIDGYAYAGELHLVHWNVEKYRNLKEAIGKHDGLAVLAVLLQVGSKNQNIDLITRHLRGMTEAGSEKLVASIFDPSSLLPYDLSRYWTYKGSLTTPGYNESVSWIIFCDSITVSQYQLDALRRLNKMDGNPICDNFRNTMPLSERDVMTSFTFPEY